MTYEVKYAHGGALATFTVQADDKRSARAILRRAVPGAVIISTKPAAIVSTYTVGNRRFVRFG